MTQAGNSRCWTRGRRRRGDGGGRDVENRNEMQKNEFESAHGGIFNCYGRIRSRAKTKQEVEEWGEIRSKIARDLRYTLRGRTRGGCQSMCAEDGGGSD